MPNAVWTPQAETDLENIAYYITVEDGRPLAARENIEAIRKKAEQYARQPELGARQTDLPTNSRYFRHKRWVAVYQDRDFGNIVI